MPSRARALVQSPFRYPGGKSWLVPVVRSWLVASGSDRLVEPFAGGASVSLAAVSEGLMRQATLHELDENVAAVWSVLLDERAYELASLVNGFELSDGNVRQVLSEVPGNELERAFATLLRNRVAWAGIMAAGGGLLRSGDNRRGFASRWTPSTLVDRIKAIAALRDQLTFVAGDGMAFLEQCAGSKAAVFIDPPYTLDEGQGAGHRLYQHSSLDHPRLFELAAAVDGEVLLTYDDQPEVRALASAHGFDVRPVPTWTAHHRRSAELLIGRGLGWLAPSVTGASRLRHSAKRTRRVVAPKPSAEEATMAPMAPPEVNDPKRFVPLNGAATALEVSRRTVERMVRDGKLERVRSGGRPYVTRDSLEQLLRRGREGARTRPAGSNADLVDSVERLVAALRDERAHLLEALQEREAARIELAAARADLQVARARCQCGSVQEAA